VAPAPVAAPAPAPAATVTVAATQSDNAPDPGAGGRHVYVVESGDSLWSIAVRMLDEGASPAQISRLVDRLWRLNADRIKSGQPNLIVAGERLLLPRGG
jgi:nucleoid-associated protein YgaU